MSTEFTVVTPVALPPQSQITGIYTMVNLADAFSIALPPGVSADPEVLARFLFANQASWIGILMTVRDSVVACFGLKTGKHLGSMDAGKSGGRVGIFKIYNKSETEIVLGEDDKHLDFRVSVLCSGEPAPGRRQLVVSTVVHCHNRLGRVYIFLIAPFHRLVVMSTLRGAARVGWPRAACA